MSEQRIPSPLTVMFTYTGTVADGDVLTIDADGTVRKISLPSEPVIGQVYSHETLIKECTVVVPYTYRRDNRIAGEAVVPGRFVWGPNNTVFQYSPAAPARVTGSTTGPKTVTVSVDDTIKVTLGMNAAQTLTITAGTGRTFAAIAAELNATLVGLHAGVDAAGHFYLEADEIWNTLIVEAVTHDAYTLLGLSANVYTPSTPSHDASAVGGLILTAGAQGAAVGTLEY
jgi:hypothetical protein